MDKIDYNEILVEAILMEDIHWSERDLDQYKSLQSLAKYNNGIFKSKKQRDFITNKWADRSPSDLKKFFGIPAEDDKKYVQVEGMYSWADYGSRSQIPFWYIFELDEYGVTRKWKVGAKGNLRIGASPDPKKVKLEFTRPNDQDVDHLKDDPEQNRSAAKTEFYKSLGGSTGKYLGTPGEKHDFGEVELIFSKFSYGDYGPRTFQILKDKDGNLIWYTGKDLGLDRGEKAHLTGKVKKHMVSKRQEKVTIIIYPKIS